MKGGDNLKLFGKHLTEYSTLYTRVCARMTYINDVHRKTEKEHILNVQKVPGREEEPVGNLNLNSRR